MAAASLSRLKERKRCERMITKIGLVAGDIWNYLDAKGRVAKMSDIIAGIGKERDIVMMSMGWLAREGHIVLEGDSANYTVRLMR